MLRWLTSVLVLIVALASLACAMADAENALYKAITANDVNEVRTLLQSHSIDEFDDELIAVATEHVINSGDKELLQVLLDAGIDPDATAFVYGDCIIGEVPMVLSAVWSDQVQIVRMLANAGADLSVVDQFGNTLLHSAARDGSEEMIALLLDLGLGANSVIGGEWYAGYTPLHCAAAAGSTGAIALLLEAGANIEAADDQRCTALYRAVESGHGDVARLLIDAGADVNRFAGSFSLLDTAIREHNVEMVRLVLDAGFDVNSAAPDGHTPLLMASTQWFIQTEDSTSYLDPRRQAAQETLTEIMKLLLAAGADVNARARNGDTALHAAATAGPVSRVEALLAAGADPNVQNLKGETPLHLAAFAGYSTYSEGFGDQWTEIIIGRTEAARALLAAGADVNLADQYGWTALHTAALQAPPELFELVLAAGPDLNARDYEGNTPLHIAICDPVSGFAGLLIDAGADPTIRNNAGETPEEYIARLTAEWEEQTTSSRGE